MRPFPRDGFLGFGIAIIVVAMLQMGCGIDILLRLCSEGRTRCFAFLKTYGFVFCLPAVVNIITGSFGIGTACTHVRNRRLRLKNGFMVLCVLSALGAGGMGYFFFTLTSNFVHTFSLDHESSAVSASGDVHLAAVWTGGMSCIVLVMLCMMGACMASGMCYSGPPNEEDKGNKDSQSITPSDHTNNGYDSDSSPSSPPSYRIKGGVKIGPRGPESPPPSYRSKSSDISAPTGIESLQPSYHSKSGEKTGPRGAKSPPSSYHSKSGEKTGPRGAKSPPPSYHSKSGAISGPRGAKSPPPSYRSN